jgi:glutamyl/glutaminyl-tRNA synthetase
VPRPLDREVIALALPHLKTRLHRLAGTDVVDLMECLFPQVTLAYDKETLLGESFADDHERARVVLELLRERYEGLDDWSKDRLEEVARAAADSLGLKFRDFSLPMRVAVSGHTEHLPIFEVMEIIGRAETLRRLQQAALMLGTGA